MSVQYRTYGSMASIIRENLHLIPRDIDLVVGIPRSGMIPASQIALHLNLPLAELSGFIQGRRFSAGRRFKASGRIRAAERVLVVDDSISTGREFSCARALIEEHVPSVVPIYMAVYGTADSREKVDLILDECPMPRVFEWNLLNHWLLHNMCFDVDGVLCRDPSPEENDDGPRYRAFLRSAPPLLLPQDEVGYLVTCRLERYRGETEQWLERYGVRYRELIMMDLPSAEARRASGSHASFKSSAYRASNAALFVESSLQQAIKIADLSSKPVLCIEANEMIYPTPGSLALGAVRKTRNALDKRARFASTKVGRQLLHFTSYGS